MMLPDDLFAGRRSRGSWAHLEAETGMEKNVCFSAILRRTARRYATFAPGPGWGMTDSGDGGWPVGVSASCGVLHATRMTR